LDGLRAHFRHKDRGRDAGEGLATQACRSLGLTRHAIRHAQIEVREIDQGLKVGVWMNIAKEIGDLARRLEGNRAGAIAAGHADGSRNREIGAGIGSEPVKAVRQMMQQIKAWLACFATPSAVGAYRYMMSF
jgi:hypothetical protein